MINEELWYGDDTSGETEQRAAESLAARVGRVLGAKPFPASAMRLERMTRDPSCSVENVVQVLESDPALSARLLRLVNSAGFALCTPCASVRHAATLVGNTRLNQMATTAAILEMYDSDACHAARILEHATVVAALSRYLAFYFGLPSDELFTCGFLHDIGKLMLLDTDGESYGALLGAAVDEPDALHPLERRQFGFDHALLAGHVLSKWNIPEPVPRVVAWHHNVGRAFEHSPRLGQIVSTLRLADALSYALKHRSPEQAIERLAKTDAAAYLEISAPQIAAMWDETAALALNAACSSRDGTGIPEAFSLRPSADRVRKPHSLAAPTPSVSPELPAALGPSRASLGTPTLQRLPSSLIPAPSKPSARRQYPCIVCMGPTFADTCPACGSYVCPDHQLGPERWCELCAYDYRDYRPAHLTLTGALVVGCGFGVLVTCFAFVSSGSLIARAVLTLSMAGALAIVFTALGYGLRRATFLRSRPKREPPLAPPMITAAVVPELDEPTAQSTEAESTEEADSPSRVVPLRSSSQVPADEVLSPPDATCQLGSPVRVGSGSTTSR